MSSEEYEESSDEEIRPVSKFAGLMDSDSNYSSEAEDEPEIPIVISAPPPPPPKKQQKKKVQVEDEDDLEEFLKQQIQNAPPPKPQVSAPHKAERLPFNLAQELKEKYSEVAFEDSNRISKGGSPLHFISRRTNWPNSTPLTYRITHVKNEEYSVEYTDYGAHQIKLMNGCETAEQLSVFLSRFHEFPFSVPLLQSLCRFRLFGQEFTVATDYCLRLTWILQQVLPPTFKPGQSRFINSPATQTLLEMIAFIARFAYRRGCYETSAALWRFGVMSSPDEDPALFCLCAAVPQLFDEDQSFLSSYVRSDRTFRGISISAVPDWSICEAIAQLPETQALDYEYARWPFILGQDEMPEELPEQLQRVCAQLKRRLAPVLERHEVSAALRGAKERSKTIDNKEALQFVIDAWSKFNDDLDVSMIVEEDVLPVNPNA